MGGKYTKPKRPKRHHKGCGVVMNNRRKKTTYVQEQSMSIWNRAKSTIKDGIDWAFSGSKKETVKKEKPSAVIKKKVKAEPEPKTVTKKVRARTVKGRYKGDDPSTPDVNEAWTTKKVNIRRVKK